MTEKIKCSSCGKLLPLNSFWKHKADPPIWRGRLKKEYYYHKCKNCCLKNIDITNIDTILPLLEEFNVPYIKKQWEQRCAIYPDNPLPRYLALMRLCGYYSYEYKDSDWLNQQE